MTLIVESLQAFLLSRPPIVAFFFSLLAITLTIFLVAFYIKDKDLILNPHAQEDWKSLMKYFNSQELCMNISNSQESFNITTQLKHQVSTNTFNGTCFPVQINMSNHSLLFKQVNAVWLEGYISLKDWERSCTNHISPLGGNANVAIALLVPAGLVYSKNDSSWVYLSGLPHPQLTSSNHCHYVKMPSPVITGKISSKLQSYEDILENGACWPGEKIQFSNISSAAPEAYLTTDDKIQIFSHLVQIGLAFCGVLFLLLTAGVVQGRTLVLTRRHTLLPTKEML